MASFAAPFGTSQLGSFVAHALQRLRAVASARPIATALSALLALRFAIVVRNDYRGWRALGPAGLPHNAIGYAAMNVLRLFRSKDLVGTHVYEPLIQQRRPGSGDARDSVSHLGVGNDGGSGSGSGELPVREGRQPATSPWVVPVRQTSARSSPELIDAHEEAMRRVVAEHPRASSSSLEVAPSAQEGRSGNAIWVTNRGDLKRAAERVYGRRLGARAEVYHVHRFCGSTHCTLSAADAKKVLDAGWGERHPLADGSLAPLGLIMVYAPRNQEELRLCEDVMRAAIGHALGQGQEGKDN